MEGVHHYNLVFVLDSGENVLVTLWVNPGNQTDTINATIAFRDDQWTTWGVPTTAHRIEVINK